MYFQFGSMLKKDNNSSVRQLFRLSNSSWFLFMEMGIYKKYPLKFSTFNNSIDIIRQCYAMHDYSMHALQDNSMESFLVGPSSHPINVECILNHLNSFLLVFELPSA